MSDGLVEGASTSARNQRESSAQVPNVTPTNARRPFRNAGCLDPPDSASADNQPHCPPRGLKGTAFLFLDQHGNLRSSNGPVCYRSIGISSRLKSSRCRPSPLIGLERQVGNASFIRRFRLFRPVSKRRRGADSEMGRHRRYRCHMGMTELLMMLGARGHKSLDVDGGIHMKSNGKFVFHLDYLCDIFADCV